MCEKNTHILLYADDDFDDDFDPSVRVLFI